jgi:hypothetical protein
MQEVSLFKGCYPMVGEDGFVRCIAMVVTIGNASPFS